MDCGRATPRRRSSGPWSRTGSLRNRILPETCRLTAVVVLPCRVGNTESRRQVEVGVGPRRTPLGLGPLPVEPQSLTSTAAAPSTSMAASRSPQPGCSASLGSIGRRSAPARALARPVRAYNVHSMMVDRPLRLRGPGDAWPHRRASLTRAALL